MIHIVLGNALHLSAMPSTASVHDNAALSVVWPDPFSGTCSGRFAGHAGVVKLLVEANALVDKANQKGTTALMLATQGENGEVVGILLSAGADVSKRNNEGVDALMLASQVRERLTDL